MIRFDNSEPFIKELAAYIATCEPFCHMDGYELERKGGLTTAKAKIAKLLTSNKRKRQKLEFFIRNMSDLRCELMRRGKKIKPKDNLILGVIWEIREIGLYHAFRTAFQYIKKHRQEIIND